jgi:hypothetical protein
MMSVVLLVKERGDASYITPRRIRVSDRLCARLRATRLDAALARGVAPESSPALALRAEALIGPVARQLGSNLRRIVLSAQRPLSGPIIVVPISRALVRETESELSALAERLLDGGPVDARGVATVRILLCDGRGPLYGHFRDAGQLRSALVAALDALEVDA